MPFAIQLQRFARLLQKKLGLQGYIPLTLLEDITPMVGVLSGEGPEDYFLREEELRAAQTTQAAAPALNARVSLVNPTDSGVLVIVERTMTIGQGSVIEAGLLVPQGVPVIGGRPRETRLAPDLAAIPANNVGLLSDSPAGVGGLSLWRVPGVANTLDNIEAAVVLRPGSQLSLTALTVNTALQGGFLWRQYRHGPQELTSG